MMETLRDRCDPLDLAASIMLGTVSGRPSRQVAAAVASAIIRNFSASATTTSPSGATCDAVSSLVNERLELIRPALVAQIQAAWHSGLPQPSARGAAPALLGQRRQAQDSRRWSRSVPSQWPSSRTNSVVLASHVVLHVNPMTTWAPGAMALRRRIAPQSPHAIRFFSTTHGHERSFLQSPHALPRAMLGRIGGHPRARRRLYTKHPLATQLLQAPLLRCPSPSLLARSPR
mmetsp:Transcript_91542/g.258514  ORF Transcript_91542/g.258514 Transcript_91542/m.258514 type:complete len:231 (-) Transcript_91542:293-985(-)